MSLENVVDSPIRPKEEEEDTEDLQAGAAAKRRRLGSSSTSAAALTRATSPIAAYIFESHSDGCLTPPREAESSTPQSTWPAAVKEEPLEGPPQSAPLNQQPDVQTACTDSISVQNTPTNSPRVPLSSINELGDQSSEAETTAHNLALPRARAAAIAKVTEDAFQHLQYDASKIKLGGEQAYWEEALVRFVAGDSVLRAYALSRDSEVDDPSQSLQRFSNLVQAPPKRDDPRKKIRYWAHAYPIKLRDKLSAEGQRTPISAWENAADMELLTGIENRLEGEGKWLRLWHNAFYLDWPDAKTTTSDASSGVSEGQVQPAATTTTGLASSSTSTTAAAFSGSTVASFALHAPLPAVLDALLPSVPSQIAGSAAHLANESGHAQPPAAVLQMPPLPVVSQLSNTAPAADNWAPPANLPANYMAALIREVSRLRAQDERRTGEIKFLMAQNQLSVDQNALQNHQLSQLVSLVNDLVQQSNAQAQHIRAQAQQLDAHARQLDAQAQQLIAQGLCNHAQTQQLGQQWHAQSQQIGVLRQQFNSHVAAQSQLDAGRDLAIAQHGTVIGLFVPDASGQL